MALEVKGLSLSTLSKPWLNFLALASTGGAVVSLVYGFAWVAKKPVTVGDLLNPWSGIVGLWFINRIFGRRPNKNRDLVAEEEFARLRELCSLVDGRAIEVKVDFESEYPRPLYSPATVAVSKMVLREFSEDALRWDIRSGIQAARRDSVSSLTLVPCFFVALLVLAFIERWRLSISLTALPIALIVIGFSAAHLLGTRAQFRADRDVTTTEEDRQAAKEALSIPYFIQRNRPLLYRWFSQRKLKMRAKNLGIELEHGFHVGPPIID